MQQWWIHNPLACSKLRALESKAEEGQQEHLKSIIEDPICRVFLLFEQVFKLPNTTDFTLQTTRSEVRGFMLTKRKDLAESLVGWQLCNHLPIT